MSKRDTTTEPARLTLDADAPASDLTAEQRARLRALAALPDDRIDTSDIPELTDAQLAQFRRPEHYRPVKQQITARVDADVLAWLKAAGPGYQSRMNAILRRAMLDAE